MSSTSEAALARSAPNLNINANTNALTATPSAMANTPSIVPSKRSDDDIQFISSQPVKKQKVTHTKLQIKITPPAPQSHNNPQQYQAQPQGHSVSRFSPILVPNIQLTPPAQGNDHEQETATELHHDRRISTGMVGLPSDFHQLEASYALRGVSLPVYTSLESFVLNQPLDRVRPMSSPPLSPRQLPPHAPDSTIYPNAMPLGINAMGDCDQSATPNYAQYGHRVSPRPQPGRSSVSTTIDTRPLTPTSSPSPVQAISMEKSNSNTHSFSSYTTSVPYIPAGSRPVSWNQTSLSSLRGSESFDGKDSNIADSHGGYAEADYQRDSTDAMSAHAIISTLAPAVYGSVGT